MTAIFREYSADALERQYMPTHWPNVDLGQTIDRWDEWSKAFHQRVNVKADNLYGFTPRQSIDMLVPSAGSAPVLAFIHGDTGNTRGSVSSRTVSVSSS